ncbi:MAG: TIGR04255 family protein [Anaerolineae bacterium]|nr:TIGR04255 family protein [Anaerolineae bacterium]
MGRRYRHPPIIEALCEFRFEPSAPWDLAIPGLIYEKVRVDFPKRQQAKAFEVNVAASPESVEQRLVTTDRIQFLREDEKALIQVDRNLLAVNHLAPYPTWQEFLPLIRLGFNAYVEVARPKGIQRIGLRYINRIEMPGQDIELEDFLEFRPFIGPDLPQNFDSFIAGIQVPYEHSRDSLRLQIASAVAGVPNMAAVLLDLDYFLAQPNQITLDNVFEWVQIAHDHVEEAFEACITDRLREMFEEVADK